MSKTRGALVVVLVSVEVMTGIGAFAATSDPGDSTTFSVENVGDDKARIAGKRRETMPAQQDLPAPGSSQAFLGRSAPPPSADLGCVGQLSAGGWSGSDLCPYRFADDEPAEEIPTIDLLYHALAHTQVSSAGLVVEPWSRTYVGVPTLVHAATPVRQEVVRVFDHDVVVDFEATSFKYDFGDGLPPLVTTDPSEGFPVMTLNHVYLEPRDQVSVVLETTWKARVVHPVTGESLTVPSALVTVEASAPLEVRKAKGYLTDTAEELMGR